MNLNNRANQTLNNLWLTGIALLAVTIDQATKYFAYRGKFGGFLNLLRPVFSKLLLPNYNFAFGIPLPHVFAYVIYAIVIGALTLWYVQLRQKNNWQEIGCYLVIAGAVSNLIDRFTLGYVRDFISAFWGNVFNFADIWIILGVLMIIYGEILVAKRSQ
jgi:signal peptidase II